MALAGGEEHESYQQHSPDDSGEKLGSVHVGDGKAGRRGKLPYHSQHGDHHRQIW
jgi:hypothetical protein